jgi:transcriptional regulator with XRE-family HTH domain
MQTSQFGIAIGSTVQALRAEHGWTQRALAERAGISAGYLSELEAGLKEPSATTLADLARSLDVEVPDFLLLVALNALGCPAPPRERRAALIAMARSLANLAPADYDDVESYLSFLAWRAAHAKRGDRPEELRRHARTGQPRVTT